MPLVTSPPININNATDRGEAPFSGPFEIGAALYLVTIESTPAQGIHVWKSTDGALTWTVKGSANQPSATGGVYNVVLIGAAFFIAFAQGSPSATLEMITFDTGTDTYGVAVSWWSIKAMSLLGLVIRGCALVCAVAGAVGFDGYADSYSQANRAHHKGKLFPCHGVVTKTTHEQGYQHQMRHGESVPHLIAPSKQRYTSSQTKKDLA